MADKASAGTHLSRSSRAEAKTDNREIEIAHAPTRTPVRARATAEKKAAAERSLRVFEELLEPGESIQDFAWLTDGRVTAGGLAARDL